MKRKRKTVMCDVCGYTWWVSQLPPGKCPKCVPLTDIQNKTTKQGDGKLLWKNDEG